MNRKAAAIALLMAFGAGAAEAAEQHLNFVTCPILRDTKTVPCWLAEYNGEVYYLGIQQDAAAEFYPPFLGHKVLAEGVVSDEPRICGGVVLKPVHISNLPELDPTCNTMLPVEDKYTVPFAVRGPGPNPKPSLNRRVGGAPAQPAAKGPFSKTSFTVYYDFDTDWANRWARVLGDAATLAKASNAAEVQVTAYRASVKLSDGQDLAERRDIAERRARRLEQTFEDLGIPASVIRVTWKDDPAQGDGQEDYKLRRAEITVTPGASAAASR
jgi:outer membrane protein OmpA-like peptidoglycan-associated protein